MIGYLHRENREDGSPGIQDVTIDYPESADFSLGSEFQVEITNGNDYRLQEAFVVPRYLLFGSYENVDRLGAEIVIPTIEPTGVFLQVGTRLSIRLIR